MACSFPFFVDGVPVPCGRCPPCLVRRSDGWAFRLTHEDRVSRSSDWITLTYDNDHLIETDNGFATLSKRDIQLFFKKLRRRVLEFEELYNVPHMPVKYFLCGEYGGQYGRPHYHVFIFNCPFHLYHSAWVDSDGVPIGQIWRDLRGVSTGNMAYTTGYMFKPRTAGKFGRDDRVPEFLMMSKKLGMSYLTPDIVRYHLSDVTRSFGVLNGRRFALPRYLLDKLYSNLSDEQIELRNNYIDTAVRAAHKRSYDEHIRMFGNADKYIDFQNNARKAHVVNFQIKHSKRKDL